VTWGRNASSGFAEPFHCAETGFKSEQVAGCMAGFIGIRIVIVQP
jgi:hypothetical protein